MAVRWQVTKLIRETQALSAQVALYFTDQSPPYVALVEVEKWLHEKAVEAPAPNVMRVELHRVEGTREECGLPTLVRTVDEAEAILQVWARTAPAPGDGYHKTDVRVTFDDGTEHRLRADLQQGETGYFDMATRYVIYSSQDACLLGKEVWAGPEMYAEWAWSRECNRRGNGYVRMAVEPAGQRDETFISKTTVSQDPLKLLGGRALLRTVNL